MYKRYRFAFGKSDYDIVESLKKLNIKPEENETNILVLYINDYEPHADEVIELFKNWSLKIVTHNYTSEEMDQAEWFSLGAAWLQYYAHPNHPEHRRMVFRELNHCENYSCYAGYEQKDDVVITQDFKKWKKSAQVLYGYQDEFFVETSLKNVLERSNLTGFHFRPVRTRKNLEIKPDMHQLVVENILPPAAVASMTYGTDTSCPVCGARRLLRESGADLYLFKSAFDNCETDIVRSAEYYGAGGLWARNTYVNQKFRKVLIDHKFDKSFGWEIVNLHE